MSDEHYKIDWVDKGILGRVFPHHGGSISVNVDHDDGTRTSFSIAGSDLCNGENGTVARLLRLLEGKPVEVGCLNNGTFVELRIDGIEVVRKRPRPRSFLQRMFGCRL